MTLGTDLKAAWRNGIDFSFHSIRLIVDFATSLTAMTKSLCTHPIGTKSWDHHETKGPINDSMDLCEQRLPSTDKSLWSNNLHTQDWPVAKYGSWQKGIWEVEN